jgi:hypothetical protein
LTVSPIHNPNTPAVTWTLPARSSAIITPTEDEVALAREDRLRRARAEALEAIQRADDEAARGSPDAAVTLLANTARRLPAELRGEVETALARHEEVRATRVAQTAAASAAKHLQTLDFDGAEQVLLRAAAPPAQPSRSR